MATATSLRATFDGVLEPEAKNMAVIEPTPIVLIGQTPRFGKVVARKLQPEYEGDSIWSWAHPFASTDTGCHSYLLRQRHRPGYY